MAATLISYSSGIIILFSYCAIITPYEKKENSSYRVKLRLTIVALIRPIIIEEKLRERMSTATEIVSNSLQILVLAMVTVLMVIVCVNKNMFTPKKSAMSSY